MERGEAPAVARSGRRAGAQRRPRCTPGTQEILTTQLLWEPISPRGSGPLFPRKSGRSSREKQASGTDSRRLPPAESGAEADAALRGLARLGRNTALPRAPRSTAAGRPRPAPRPLGPDGDVTRGGVTIETTPSTWPGASAVPTPSPVPPFPGIPLRCRVRAPQDCCSIEGDIVEAGCLEGTKRRIPESPSADSPLPQAGL